jgi:phospholipid/cholesterol/gamma-HCH transport system permease protein
MPRVSTAFTRAEDWFVALAQIARLGLDALTALFRKSLPIPTFLSLTLTQIFSLGVRSISVVLVAGIATGSIMALQLGYGLKRFGGNLYIPAIVGISVLREIGPILSSLLLAGRIGSGITAEIASMTVTEQVDAIYALGGNPSAELVAPRVIACIFVFPVLSLIADYVGILAAMWLSLEEFGIPTRFYLIKTLEAVRIQDVAGGLIKTLVFGFGISLLACWKGLKTRGGTRGVGNSTTEVVVASCIFILIGDVFMSKLFIELGWFGGFTP